VVTGGSAFADIDVYGAIIAYAELLRQQGKDAVAVSTAPLNESIPPLVREWPVAFSNTYNYKEADQFVIIDVSDPKYFDPIVDHDHISEVIDHHPGFESYWDEQIGKDSHIEFIGAACTLVYERWARAGLADSMSQVSARLLICGILDNTLNFSAKVTTQRDHNAHDALLRIADLPSNWTAQYFFACQDSIVADIEAATRNDIKVLTFKTYPYTLSVGQIVAWDANGFIDRYGGAIMKVVVEREPRWFVNFIDLSRGRSVFFTQDPEVQHWLAGLLGATFDGDSATADRAWLRKEIIKQDISAAK
jgi:nanoRNase/pAp phosphatase (c-di-AMP/oligoRNAs hydrolase)